MNRRGLLKSPTVIASLSVAAQTGERRRSRAPGGQPIELNVFLNRPGRANSQSSNRSNHIDDRFDTASQVLRKLRRNLLGMNPNDFINFGVGYRDNSAFQYTDGNKALKEKV